MTETVGTTTGEATVTRIFDAPRPLVWKMFTEPEHWFHGRLADHLAQC